MSNFYKVRSHLRSIIKALDNVEHGRMPLEVFEGVFENRTETIRDLIRARYQEGVVEKAESDGF